MNNSPLRFNVQKNGWTVSELENVTTLIKDGTHGTHIRQERGIPLLSAKDISKNGKIILDQNPSLISEQDYLSIHSSYEIKINDLLLTVVGTLGRCAICNITDKFSIQRSVAVIRVNKLLVYPEYLYYFILFDWFQNQLMIRSNATAQAGVYLGELSHIDVAYPSLKEQKKIAKLLGIVDSLIITTQLLIDKYIAIKEGVLSDLFIRGIDLSGTPETNSNYGQLRLSVEEAPELYKQTELGWLPKDWTIKSLENCTTKMAGGAAIKTHEFSKEGVGVIAKSDVTSSKFIDVSLRPQKVTEEAASKYSRSLVNENYVVVTLRDLVPSGPTVGMAARFKDNGEYLLAQGTYGFMFDDAIINPDIFVEYTRQSWFRSKIKALTVGSTQVHVRSSEYIAIDLPLPPLYEQQKILEKIESLDKNIINTKQELAKYKLLKKGLMQDLLTGKVQVDKAVKC